MYRCLLVFLVLVIVIPSSMPYTHWHHPQPVITNRREMDYEPEYDDEDHGEINLEMSKFESEITLGE